VALDALAPPRRDLLAQRPSRQLQRRLGGTASGATAHATFTAGPIRPRPRNMWIRDAEMASRIEPNRAGRLRPWGPPFRDTLGGGLLRLRRDERAVKDGTGDGQRCRDLADRQPGRAQRLSLI
jgi:hypothetical protein